MMWFCVLLLSIWVFYGDACTTTGMPQPGSDVRPQGAEKDRVTAEASAPGIVELLAWGLVLLDMEQERMLGKPGRFGRHSQGHIELSLVDRSRSCNLMLLKGMMACLQANGWLTRCS